MLDDRRQAEDEIRDADERANLALVLRFVRRSARLLLIGAVLGGLIGAIYGALAEPMYVSTARLLLERPRSASPAGDPGLIQFTLDTSQIESQIQVILSEFTTRRVITELGLQSDPEFTGQRTSPLESFSTLVRSYLPSQESLVEPPRGDRILIELSNRLAARRVGQSYAIEVSFWSNSAEKAARIANSVAAAYIGNQLDQRVSAAENGSELIARRLSDLRMNVLAAQEAMRTGIIDVSIFPSADVRVISAASPPLGKSWPRTKLMILLGALVGILLASLFALKKSRPS